MSSLFAQPVSVVPKRSPASTSDRLQEHPLYGSTLRAATGESRHEVLTPSSCSTLWRAFAATKLSSAPQGRVKVCWRHAKPSPAPRRYCNLELRPRATGWRNIGGRKFCRLKQQAGPLSAFETGRSIVRVAASARAHRAARTTLSRRHHPRRGIGRPGMIVAPAAV